MHLQLKLTHKIILRRVLLAKRILKNHLQGSRDLGFCKENIKGAASLQTATWILTLSFGDQNILLHNAH